MDIIHRLKQITQSYKKAHTILLCKASIISIWAFFTYASLKLASCVSIVAASDFSSYLIDILIDGVESAKTGYTGWKWEMSKRNAIRSPN